MAKRGGTKSNSGHFRFAVKDGIAECTQHSESSISRGEPPRHLGWSYDRLVALRSPVHLTRDRGSMLGDNSIENRVASPEEASMKIDIDRLTEDELVDLNHRIVARLRFLHQMRAHAEMLEFKIGDRVVFRPPGQGQVGGMLTRYNKKTVTVITDDGRQWNVSPQLLSRVVSPAAAHTVGSNVVPLGKR